MPSLSARRRLGQPLGIHPPQLLRLLRHLPHQALRPQRLPEPASQFPLRPYMVWDRNKVPSDVDRVDLATGRRTRVFPVLPADPVGIPGIQGLYVTPDARALVYNVTRKLSGLYLVEGLK